MKKLIYIIKKIKRDPKIIILYIASTGILNWIPDEIYLKLLFYSKFGEKLDLNNPKNFNEKLQWLKLNDRNELYNTLVDKVEVRKYISENIGEEYLIPLIGIWNSVEEIDFSILPNRFVIKCTHDSGSVFICNDKKEFDFKYVKKSLKKSLKKNYYYSYREWPYKNLKPRIICEEFLGDNKKVPDDYKVLCFNGKAKLISVHIDRFGEHYLDNYDRDWNKTQIAKDGQISNKIYEKPIEFDKMIELSERIAKNMKHVRVDWFIVNDKLYFGEITLYQAAGFDNFDNHQDNYLLGSWIDLGKVE